ncbi:MAG: sulfotransferase family protein [Pseudomonadota bacterium]
MSLKVIGAGYGRNGTLSLKHALEQLGFSKCYHMMEVNQDREEDVAWLKLAQGGEVDFDKLFEGYQASVDWPSCNFWREQLAWSPEAKVILSERDPEKWYASIMNTIYPMSVAAKKIEDPLMQRRSEMVFEVIWDGLFDGRLDDKDHVIDVYLKHNQAVKDELPPEKLLVFEASQGWAPLCEFLEVPIPDEPYPRVNTTEDFNTMMASRRAERARDQDGD